MGYPRSGAPGSRVGMIRIDPSRGDICDFPAPHIGFPDLDPNETRFLGTLFRRESLGGLLALVAAAIALLWANLGQTSYDDFQHYDAVHSISSTGPPTARWRSSSSSPVLNSSVNSSSAPCATGRRPGPVSAAVAGVVVPSLIFLLSTSVGPTRGWAIPAATDIAFALAVLAVVGSNLPASLRAFLLTLAVVDDLIVIVIIAVFYTESLSISALAISIGLMIAYSIAQHFRIHSPLVLSPPRHRRLVVPLPKRCPRHDRRRGVGPVDQGRAGPG